MDDKRYAAHLSVTRIPNEGGKGRLRRQSKALEECVGSPRVRKTAGAERRTVTARVLAGNDDDVDVDVDVKVDGISYRDMHDAA